MKTKYYVVYEVLYSDTVEANSPEEAADTVARNCPYDVDGEAHVVNLKTKEEWNV